jgi:two-component system CheB/CheR fusion protein
VTGGVSEPQRAALERVGRELARLTTLVDDLLELARLEAGGSAPNLESIELGDLARECVEALGPRAHERGIALRAEGSGRARADSAMMRRVLWNLIDNGLKFTPSGGTVRVRVSNERFYVADDGPGGVPADAFERFRQGASDAAGGAKPEGVGLGLAIVARLVELHGGSIAVRDRAADGAHGAEFTVRLPAAEQGGAT